MNPVDMTHFGRPWCQQHGSGRVCLVTGHTLSLRGPSPQALTLLGGVYCLVPGVPLFRGMLVAGPEAFLEPLGASGLWPCARTHLKKGLVLHSSGWWDGQQIPLLK